MILEPGPRSNRWLRVRVPVFGTWIRGLAAIGLGLSRSAGGRRILAEEVAQDPGASLRSLILRILRQVRDPESVAQICGVWAQTRHPDLEGLVVNLGWVPAGPTSVRVLAALKTGALEVPLAEGPLAITTLLEACRDLDPEISRNARTCLGLATDPESINLLCSRWVEDRDEECLRVILENKLQPTQPPRVRVMTLLKLGLLDPLESGGREFVMPLADATRDRDDTIRRRARQVLEQLSSQSAREALCELVVNSGLPVCREIAVRSGYLPREIGQRALFLFLTEQWDRYLELDFDQGLLGSQFENGSARIRSRIAETARQAGRTEWITVIQGGRQNRQLHELTDEEWDAALTVMQAAGRWKAMWQLAQGAPADWGNRLLKKLSEAPWSPTESAEADAFRHLVSLAADCRNDPPFSGRLIRSGERMGVHAGKVTCLQWTHNGRRVVSGSEDGSVGVWSPVVNGRGRRMEGHCDWVLCAAVCQGDVRLATGSADGSIRFWGLESGELKGVSRGHEGPVRCIAFAGDSGILVSGGGDRLVKLWRFGAGTALRTLEGHSDEVSCLALSPDGRVLATGSYDNDIRLWSMPGGDPIRTLRGHRAMVNCLAFDPTGAILISGSKDRLVILWDVPRGALLRRLKGHRDDISCLAVSPDGQTLASGSWDYTLRLWNLTNGELRDTLGRSETNDGHSGWITCLAYSTDGALLASGSSDHSIRLWSSPGGAPLRILEGHQDRVSCIQFSADGRSLVSGGWDKQVLIWKSELARLRQIPIARTTLEDLDWVEKVLSNSHLSATERAWLEFLEALMRWRRRYDIQLGDASPITVGEFDIEIGD